MQEFLNENKGNTTRRTFLGVEASSTEGNVISHPGSGHILERKNMIYFEQPQISIASDKQGSKGNKESGEEVNEKDSKSYCSDIQSRTELAKLPKYQQSNNLDKEEEKMQATPKSTRRLGIVKEKGQFHESKFNDLIFQVRMKNKARKLANSTQSRMQKNLTLNQLRMIGDKTFDNYQSKQSIESYFSDHKNETFDHRKSSFNKLFQKINMFLPVIDPRGKLKTIFEVINMFAVLLIFWSLSIVIAFKFKIEEIIPLLYIQISLGCLFANSFINFNTGVYLAGKLVSDRQRMFQTFKDTHLLIDILAFISILSLLIVNKISQESMPDDMQKSQIEISDRVSVLRIALFIPFFFKIRDFSNFAQSFEEKIIFHQKAQNYIQLAKLFSNIILIEHIISCLWIFQAKLSFNINSNWLTMKQFDYFPWYRQYTLSFYYSTVTMTTVGYGDITPSNQIEYVFSTIFIIFSSGIFAFTINQIGTIFTEMGAEENETRRKFNIINIHMEKRNVSQSLRTQIREYLDYVWKESNEKFAKDSEAIIDQLNDSLKREIQLHQNKRIIDYLKGHYSEKFIEKAITLIEEQECKPQQVIYNAGENNDLCLYLVEKGSVEIYFKTKAIRQAPQNIHILHEIREGQLFGVRQFYTGNGRELNIRAVGFSNLLCIKRSDFLTLLQDFPEDMEMFCYIRDRMVLLSDYWKASSVCPSCSSSKHNLMNCPYLHYLPNGENIKMRYSFEPKNAVELKRRSSEEIGIKVRKVYRWDNSLDIRQPLQQFIDDNMDYLDGYEENYLSYNFDFSHMYLNDPIQVEEEEEEAYEMSRNVESKKKTIQENNNSSIVEISNQNVENLFNFNQTTQVSPISNSKPSNEAQENNQQFGSYVYQNSQEIFDVSSDMAQQYPLLDNQESSSLKLFQHKKRRQDSIPSVPLIKRQSQSNHPLNSPPSHKRISSQNRGQIAADLQQDKASSEISKHSDQRDSTVTFNAGISSSHLTHSNEQQGIQLRRQKRELSFQNTQTAASLAQQSLHGFKQYPLKQGQQPHIPSIQNFASSHAQLSQGGNSSQNTPAKNQFQRFDTRCLSLKMNALQQNILDKISKIIDKGTTTFQGAQDSHLDNQEDNIEEFHQKQQIFRHFDKQKNYDVYFPFHNLTYILLKLQLKSQQVLNAYLDHLQNKKKQQNQITTSNNIIQRGKFDKLMSKNDRFMISSRTAINQSIGESRKRSILFDKPFQIDSPVSDRNMISSRSNVFLNQNGNSFNINNLNNNSGSNLNQKKVFSLSKYELSLQENEDKYELSPTIKDSDKESNLNDIHILDIYQKREYFPQNSLL